MPPAINGNNYLWTIYLGSKIKLPKSKGICNSSPSHNPTPQKKTTTPTCLFSCILGTAPNILSGILLMTLFYKSYCPLHFECPVRLYTDLALSQSPIFSFNQKTFKKKKNTKSPCRSCTSAVTNEFKFKL